MSIKDFLLEDNYFNRLRMKGLGVVVFGMVFLLFCSVNTTYAEEQKAVETGAGERRVDW